LVLFLVSRAGDAPRFLGDPQEPELARRFLRAAREHQVRAAPLYFGGARQALLASRFPELAALQGLHASAEDQLPRVCREVDVLLGVTQVDRTSDEAGLEVWRERLVYTTSVADQRERTIKWLRWLLFGTVAVTVAVGVLAVMGAHNFADANAHAVALSQQLASVSSQLTAAESSARSTSEELASRDQNQLQALREKLAPLQDAVKKASATTDSLAARVAALPVDADNAASIDQANAQLELSSNVTQELATKIAGLKADVESATLSDRPKQQLQQEVAALAAQQVQQQQALASAAARLDQLASHQKKRSRGELARDAWRHGYAAYSAGKLAEARSLFEKSRSLDPSYAPPLASLGKMAADDLRFTDAAELYNKAHKVDPKFAPAAGNLALLSIQQGKLNEAQKWAETALKANPDYTPARVSLKTIQDTLAEARPKK
jgi:tetratricopeptide (TPR) repeat protein